MSLVKKTIVLSNGSPKGYVTLVRVGNEVGVKIVGETFREGMTAVVRIGRETFESPLSGKRTETETSVLLAPDSIVGCAVLDGERIVATGGRIAESDLSDRKKEEEMKAEIPVVSTEPSPAPSPAEGERPKEEREREDPKKEEQNIESSEEEEKETNEAESAENAEREDEKGENDATEEREMLRRIGEGTENYYVGISDRVDELFVVYPPETNLSRAIPDSEWVKVRYDGEDYYVVGKLSEEGKVKYLGYGVPGFESLKPPKVADGIANWFPLAGVEGFDGYWLFFQDAETGKIDA